MLAWSAPPLLRGASSADVSGASACEAVVCDVACDVVGGGRAAVDFAAGRADYAAVSNDADVAFKLSSHIYSGSLLLALYFWEEKNLGYLQL